MDINLRGQQERFQNGFTKYYFSDMVRLENWDRTLVQEEWQNTSIFYVTRVLYD